MADTVHLNDQNGVQSKKFSNPDVTLDGSVRAEVRLDALQTLWINTGTLCNIECANCYIESSPTNDRLTYLTGAEASPFIKEAKAMGASELGITGGEPFMNPHLFAMVEEALANNLSVLILTNAMRPMMRPRVQSTLAPLIEKSGEQIKIRVSLDHFSQVGHDAERGQGSFDEGVKGLKWLAENGANLSIAGRAALNETEESAKLGYQSLFDANNLPLDANNPDHLVLFPEMNEEASPPEVSEQCWSLLGVDPSDMMCASSRMVVKRQGAKEPTVLACTLIAYDERFDLGESLEEASSPVKLNHPHCATFCVLGGSSCTG